MPAGILSTGGRGSDGGRTVVHHREITLCPPPPLSISQSLSLSYSLSFFTAHPLHLYAICSCVRDTVLSYVR